MQTFSGYKLLTRRYKPAYSHLDESAYVGEFRILRASPVRIEGRYGDSATSVLTVLAPRGVSDNDIEQVLRDQFVSGCRCEHDCCGHWSTYVARARNTKRREWFVVVRHSQNV